MSTSDVAAPRLSSDAPLWAQQYSVEVAAAVAKLSALAVRVREISTTKSALPSAALNAANAQQAPGRIWVSDAAGGAVFAYSDGTHWLRIDTNAIIS